ncbi:MAG: NosD domain-containing protein [Flavobacteriaceae bacterium]
MFSNENRYTRNEFRNNGAGTAVMFSNHIEMTQNIFAENQGSHAYGLLLKEVSDLNIQHNKFQDNTIGIHAEGLNRILYEHNDFNHNGWAVRIRGACLGNVFRYNNFRYNSFDVSYTGLIHNNRFESNYWSQYSGYDLDRDQYGDIPYRPVKLFSVISNRTPETLILLKSAFVSLLNYSEQVAPIFTPVDLMDQRPVLKPFAHDPN